METPRRHVVVVGGGFGGLSVDIYDVIVNKDWRSS
jgi:hypothetical protein